MPKVGKNTKLSRVARRVASEPLPTPLAASAVSKNDPTTKHDDDEPNTPEGQALSRGQRKRQAKRDQFLKKEKMILSTLMLQKREEQKGRIDGLDAIREALLDTTKTSSTKEETKDAHQPTYGTNRAKKVLMTSEIERMNLVLEHPAFKADPFGTLQEHLKNTLAEQKEKREKDSIKKAEEDKLKKEAKKQEKKERLQGVSKSRKKYRPRRCR